MKSLHSDFLYTHTFHLSLNEIFFFTVYVEGIIFILQMRSFQLGLNYSMKKWQLPHSQSRNSFKGYKSLSTLHNKPIAYIVLLKVQKPLCHKGIIRLPEKLTTECRSF